MDFKTVKLRMSDDVRQAMEDRGINEDDVREVLEYAETEGCKLYAEGENRFLGKKRIHNFTVNVEYAIDGEGIEVRNLYCHMVQLAEDRTEGA